jgi:hypothetical protein
MSSPTNESSEAAHATDVEAAAVEPVSLEGVEMTELNPRPGSFCASGAEGADAQPTAEAGVPQQEEAPREATQGEGEPPKEETVKEKHKRESLENVNVLTVSFSFRAPPPHFLLAISPSPKR